MAKQDFLAEVAAALGVPLPRLESSKSFTQLGGNSLQAIQIKSACKSKGIEVTIESLLASSCIAELVDTISKPTLFVPSLDVLRQLSKRKSEDTSREVSPKSCSILNIHLGPAPSCRFQSFQSAIRLQAPATEMQMCFVHGSQTNPGSNIIQYQEIHLLDHLHTLKTAWRTVAESEPILRTSLIITKDGGMLIEYDKPIFDWTEVVLDSDMPTSAEANVENPQYQVGITFKVLISPRQDQHKAKCCIIWSVHHALIDGYSSLILLDKVRRVVAGLSIRPGLSFVRLARDLYNFEIDSREEGKLFWKQQAIEYGGANGNILLPLPLLKTPSSQSSSHFSSLTISSPLQTLSDYARSQGITLAAIYFAAWAMTLCLHVGSDTVTFGVVFSCRSLPLNNITDTVGSLVNTLPFNVHVDREMSIKDFVNHVFKLLLELSRFQWTVPKHGYERQFSSALNIQIKQSGVENGHILPVESPTTKVMSNMALALSVEPDGTLTMNYHTKVYSKHGVEQIMNVFQMTLSSISIVDCTVGMCLEGLFRGQRGKELLTMGNCDSFLTTIPSVTDDLITLFERCVSRHGKLFAVEKGECRLTYGDLNHQANVLSKRISRVIEPGQVVCVIADRSINWIISIYGILKAGAIYCPLDEALPTELAISNFKAASARLLLAQSKAQKAHWSTCAFSCLSVEEVLKTADELKLDNIFTRENPSPLDDAYLCFTSGSSGEPKGVLCSHAGLVAFQKDTRVRLFAGPGRKIAQIMSPAFDGSIHEIFSALSYGGTLILSSSIDPFAHLSMVDSAILTPSIARLLNPHDFPRLKTVYLIGEAVSQRVNDSWSTEKELFNMYGPTEATCGATIKRLLPHIPVTIGTPNPSTRIYILDSKQRMIPRGVIGEIYLAGVQVARCYVGRPEETAHRFLNDIFSADSAERMYRTGDQGYWTKDGEIICLGRHDRQIKLRGFRLDLDDLEVRALHAIPHVTAIAMTLTDGYLVCLIQPATLDITKTASLLEKALPPYALPRHIIAVDHFPMTKAGKIDNKKISCYFEAARSPLVNQKMTPACLCVASAIRQVLKLPSNVTIDDKSNFMQMGGSSIEMLLLSHTLEEVFHRPVPLISILRAETVSQLADSIEASRIMPDETSQSSLGSNMISPIELDWFNKHQEGRGLPFSNVSYACTFAEEIDRLKLVDAWNFVLGRHAILRSRYMATSEGIRREYSLQAPQVQTSSRINIRKEVNRPFELGNEDPVRVTISNNQMTFIASHIICDLTTLRILLQEAASYYTGQALPLVRKVYMETTLWNGSIPLWKARFWRSYLKNPPQKNTAFSGLNHSRMSYDGCSRVYKVPTALFRKMDHYILSEKVTFHQLSLAAVALALTYDRDVQDIVLGAPYINRASKADVETVGLFLEPLPIRIRYPPRNCCTDVAKIVAGQTVVDSVKSFVSEARRSSQTALLHAMPWNQLLESLNIAPTIPNHPLFDVMVTFHERESSCVFPLPSTSPLYTWSDGAKFKLMVEFLAVSQDVLMLRLEYDAYCLSIEEIILFQSLLTMALTLLSEGRDYGDVKEELRRVPRFERNVSDYTEEFFAVALDKL